jgi:hypothetical protein
LVIIIILIIIIMTAGDKNKNKIQSSGLINTKKQVSVDESSNEVWEFPRILPQEKPNVWLTKMEIGQFRKEAQEEVMMEQVRDLVKVKLVEEYSKEHEYDEPTGTDDSNEEDLEERVKEMEGRLDQIMKQSKEQILSFLEPSSSSAAAKEEPSSAAPPFSLIEQSSNSTSTSTSTSTSNQQQSDEEDSSSFNWLSDCTEYWHDIPADIQQAAKDLGFTQALWDNSLQPEESNKWWQDLSASQRNAAEKLGCHRTTWDQQPGQSPMNDDGPDGSGTLTKKQKTDETANHVEPKNKNNKDADEKAEKDKSMPNSLSDNNKEDSQEKAKEEQVISKFLSQEKVDSEETVHKDELISNFLSDKKEDSQETPPTTTLDEDEDEDEFISNFLLDDKKLSALLQEQVPVADNNSSRSSLEQMYVPSDDEFDEHEDGFDEGGEQELELESSPLVQTRTTTEDEQQEESTPLLGLGHAIPASKRNLFHRLRTNLLASNVDPNCHVPSRGDNDDKPKTQGHGKNRWPAASLYPILILILGLILFWVGFSRYMVL